MSFAENVLHIGWGWSLTSVFALGTALNHFEQKHAEREHDERQARLERNLAEGL